MNFLSWLQSFFSVRHKALWNYRRGMARANKHDYQGALANYTAAIEAVGIPGTMKAMVLYNRALVYVAAGDDPKGADDFDAVLEIDEAIVNVKSMARHKLALMESRIRKNKANKH